MRPQKKSVIKTFEEAVCKNCLLSVVREADNVFCFRAYCGKAPVVKPTAFCKSGLWHIIVAQDRISTASFEIVCDYLE